jgi:hypothetical protein
MHVRLKSLLLTPILLTFVAQTAPAPAPAARLDKAREFLKLAQNNLAKSSNEMLADMGRGGAARAQAALGDLAGAKKAATSIGFLKSETQIGIARIQAWTDKQGAVEYIHSLAASASPNEVSAIGAAEAEFGDIAGAQKTAAGMRPSWQQAQIYAGIATAQIKAGDSAAGAKSFAAARDALKANTDRYSRFGQIDLVRVQLDVGDVAGAKETANGMSDADLKEIALGWLEKRGATPADPASREALEASRKALADSKTAEPEPYLSLAYAYAKSGDKETAKSLLLQAREKAEAIDPQSEHHAEALASVSLDQRGIDDAAAAETMRSALAAAAKMTNRGNACHAYWMIAADQARAGDTAGAKATLALAMKETMDPAETAMRAGAVASGMARADHEKADLSWIEHLKTPEQKGLAYAAAAEALADPEDEKKQ